MCHARLLINIVACETVLVDFVAVRAQNVDELLVPPLYWSDRGWRCCGHLYAASGSTFKENLECEMMELL
jgi:hypothetical protein